MQQYGNREFMRMQHVDLLCEAHGAMPWYMDCNTERSSDLYSNLWGTLEAMLLGGIHL